MPDFCANGNIFTHVPWHMPMHMRKKFPLQPKTADTLKNGCFGRKVKLYTIFFLLEIQISRVRVEQKIL